MSWSEAQVASLAEAYFREGSARCPGDNTPLKVEKLQYVGRKTADLFLHCRRCGTSATWGNKEPTSGAGVWPAAARKLIVDSYWEHGYANCPVDGANLTVHESRQLGSKGGAHLLVHCVRCGRHFSDDGQGVEDQEEKDPFLAKYEVIRSLGKGGMATVDLVRDRRTGDELAAKTIAPERAREAGFIERFRRETGILRGLSHPNVVKIIEEFTQGDRATYVMEYLSGGDLGQAISDPNRDVHALAQLFADAAEGVTHLHGRGFIHRDLKPSNILIGNEGRARVSDFGLAIQAERNEAVTRTGEFLGTKMYAAPEQLRGARDVNEKADIYSLGLIAIQVLSRKLSQPELHLWTDGTDPASRALANALNQDPAKRTVTPRELALAVRERALMEMAVTAQAGGPATGEKYTLLESIPDDDRMDEHLAARGLRRVGKGRPRAGQLYLGRGGPMSDGRGIYRREVDNAPGNGFSGADLFELLERG